MGARRTVLKLAVSRSGAAGVFSTFDMGALMLSRVITVTLIWLSVFFFFFQAEDGIRDRNVTGVQTCALPIYFSRQLLRASIPLAWNSQAAPISFSACSCFINEIGWGQSGRLDILQDINQTQQVRRTTKLPPAEKRDVARNQYATIQVQHLSTNASKGLS